VKDAILASSERLRDMATTSGSAGALKSWKRRARLEFIGRFGAIPSPKAWVFVAACPDSGTKLLRALLGSHPQIGVMRSEGQFLTDQLVLSADLRIPRLFASRPDIFRMLEEDGKDIDVPRLKRHWRQAYDDPSLPVLLEDSPPNAARCRWLQEHFQPASFIHLIRNGYAVAEGIHRHTGQPLELAASQWLSSNTFVLDDLEHLERAITVKYEDLCSDPDETCRRILCFLDLPDEGFSVAGREWPVHGLTGPVRNMNPTSLARLSAEEKARIRSIAFPLMHRFGY